MPHKRKGVQNNLLRTLMKQSASVNPERPSRTKAFEGTILHVTRRALCKLHVPDKLPWAKQHVQSCSIALEHTVSERLLLSRRNHSLSRERMLGYTGEGPEENREIPVCV